MTPELAAIREGATGILRVSKQGESATFVPDYDMDKARALLLEIQELRDDRGVSLKDNYREEGFNWYPTMVSYLFWYLCFPYIKYAPLVAEWMDDKTRFTWESDGQFRTLMGLLDGQACRFSWRQRLHYFLLQWNNRRVARKSHARLLFFRFARNDFRTKEIRKVLDMAGAAYLEVVPAPRTAEIVRGLLKGEDNYFFSQPPIMGRGNRFQRRYALEHLDAAKRRLFTAAIRVVETSITSFIFEYRDHLHALRQCQAKTFYGLDDVNGYIFPVLYACRTLGMRTIGHQHGAYVKRHAGYIMEGIRRGDFQWFDQVIVWGEYWKRKMLRDSNVYPADFFIVGSNKFTTIFSSAKPVERKPQTILIPYEFLANTAKVGKYIQKFIELGYTIVFKPRSDEALADQLDAYCLPVSCQEKLKIVQTLDAATLASIDIVAGTMTTLVYELLPCNKVIWILETEYRHLEDLVEEGLAHKVRYEDLGHLDENCFKPTEVSKAALFGVQSLEETLRTVVLGTRMTPAPMISTSPKKNPLRLLILPMKNKTATISNFLQPFIRLFVRFLLLFPRPVFLGFLKIIRRLFSQSFNAFLFDDCLARYLRQGYGSVPVTHCSLEITVPLHASLDVGDYIQRSFYLFGYPPFTAELMKFCNQETAFFDIGANLGLISLAVAQRTPANFIFAFEPEPKNFVKLQAILLNNCPEAHPLQLGLSEKEGQLEMKSVGHDSGSASFEIAYLDSRNATNKYDSESTVMTVKVSTFDSFVKTINISDRKKVAVKIDVEGHELSVLRGMRQFFSEARQEICIVIETHKRNYDEVHGLLSAEKFILAWPPAGEIEAFNSGAFSAIDLIYLRR